MNSFNRTWIISDLHFGIRSNSLEWLEIQKDYFDNFFIKKLEENYQDGDVLFVLGDVFDNRSILSILVINVVIDIFERMSKILPIHILVGNHDLYKKSSNDINSLKILSHIPNIKVYENDEILRVNGKKLALISWQPNDFIDKSVLEEYKADYLFCHSTFNGAYYNKYTQINDKENNIKDINYKRIFSGHIHYRQDIKNFSYVGCPYHLSRSDIDNTKGIYIFDINSNKYEFIENDYSPKFIKISIDDILDLEYEEYLNIIKNNFVDIIVDNKWNLIFPFNKMVEVSENCRKLEFKLISEDEYKELEFSDSELTNFNIIDLSNKYINDTDYPDKIKNLISLKINELYNKYMEEEL